MTNIAWRVWVGLAFGEALGFVAVGQRLLLRLRAWPLAVAGWWVAAEALRDRVPWGGFPWGRLAMSQAQAPTVRWVALGGAPLLSLLVALVGAVLAWLALAPPRRRGRRALAAVTATAVAVLGGVLPAGSASSPSATVAAVQGDVPRSRSLADLVRATTVTRNHAVGTQRLAAEVRAGVRAAPEVVIWPENSSDLDPHESPAVSQTIAAAVAAIDRPVLVGAVLDDPVRNAGQLWLPCRATSPPAGGRDASTSARSGSGT